jgi:uncharacterized Zn finger protein
MSRWDYWDYYTPSQPKKAKGGIKAQTRRGQFGSSWWAKRWIAVLEGFNIGARLSRGRSYARRGQVLSIDINQGIVSAEVQGSRSRPYKVTIKVKTISKADWKRLANTLGKQAIFSAKLLAGEMPADIEKAFAEAGLSLFPEKRQALHTTCSCPDWSNPCKHIAAVYYLLGEEFDRNPFLIFKLRGMEREELAGLIANPTGRNDKKGAAGIKAEAPPADPLSPEPDTFWGQTEIPADILGEVCIPRVSAALAKRLGNFPFWRGADNFMESMDSLYRNASGLGLEIFLGEKGVRMDE